MQTTTTNDNGRKLNPTTTATAKAKTTTKSSAAKYLSKRFDIQVRLKLNKFLVCKAGIVFVTDVYASPFSPSFSLGRPRFYGAAIVRDTAVLKF